MEFGLSEHSVLKSMSGMEFFEAIVSGRLAHPPMAEVMGMRLMHAEYGLIRWEAQVPENVLNPMGTVHGGFALTILDSALACSVHSCVERGQCATTIEVKANLTRPVPAGGKVTCEGRMVTLGKRVGTSEAKLYDANDKVLGFGTSSIMIFDL
ncbi:MAG: PaaI family thioesterase [Marinovum sp.]|nr:PaaI family thioesterase [Marinovum sp.]